MGACRDVSSCGCYATTRGIPQVPRRRGRISQPPQHTVVPVFLWLGGVRHCFEASRALDFRRSLSSARKSLCSADTRVTGWHQWHDIERLGSQQKNGGCSSHEVEHFPTGDRIRQARPVLEPSKKKSVQSTPRDYKRAPAVSSSF